MTAGFVLAEATVSSVHQAFLAGTLTARGLVESYVDRIERLDRGGPSLNSIVTVHKGALRDAARLDERLASTGRLVGPLHGVPLLVKDQFETREVETSFGSAALRDHRPGRDADVVALARAAGAIVLAKTSMPDFAMSWFSPSTRSGETKNPYDLTRDGGGSSSGTAVGLAANLGLLGIGQDTGGSIRVPGAVNCLVGIRPTPGLVSNRGASPFVPVQDTPGPMARTVADAARLLAVLSGGHVAAKHPTAWPGELRIGVLRPEGPVDGAVAAVFEEALRSLALAGVRVVDPVRIPDLDEWLARTAQYTVATRRELNRFLARLRLGAVETLYPTVPAQARHGVLARVLASPVLPASGGTAAACHAARRDLAALVLRSLHRHRLDVLCFPSVRELPPTLASLRDGATGVRDFAVNTMLAAHAGLPAMTVPAGFTARGLPVGLEAVARAYDEPTLLRFGLLFEQLTRHRRPPDGILL